MQSTIGTASTKSWTPSQKALFLGLLAVAVVSVPYLVPVKPSISLSYVVGFSNRTAVLLLVLGTALFAWVTRGEMAEMDAADSTLSPATLYIWLGIVLAACLIRWQLPAGRAPGHDAVYFFNRLQMLAAGRAPFQQFEFVYGPLLLYPSYWIMRLLHTSAKSGYYAWWTIQWLIGTFMIWALVRAMDFPIRRRNVLFGFLFLAQINAIMMEGMNSGPFRSYCAAFVVYAAHWAWKRFGGAWALPIAGLMALCVAIACSVDQAIGVAAGLAAYLLLLSVCRWPGSSWKGFFLFIAGCVVCFGLAARGSLLVSLSPFASGGFSFPILPSPSILLVLFIYVVAGCLLVRCIYQKRLDSVVIPLTLAGCAMLPSALGRCDMWHIVTARPAFVVGVAGIFAMSSIRRWWLPCAFLGICIIPAMPVISGHLGFIQRIAKVSSRKSTPASAPVQLAAIDSSNGIVSHVALTIDDIPCDRTYFTPVQILPFEARMRPECLDTGYYLDMWDVLTPDAIERKVDEMRQRPSEPLLLRTQSLEQQLPIQEDNIRILYLLELSFFVPPARHAPLSFDPVISYIRLHYVPGPIVSQGRLRVWYPAA